MNERVEQWDDASVKDFLDDLGMDVMAVRGGSAGPLYGTLVGGLGARLGDDENELSADAARRMFAGCLAEMQDITNAQVGDKTMMDALIPAVEAAQTCPRRGRRCGGRVRRSGRGGRGGSAGLRGLRVEVRPRAQLRRSDHRHARRGRRVHLAVLAGAGAGRRALEGNPACRSVRRAFLFRLSND